MKWLAKFDTKTARQPSKQANTTGHSDAHVRKIKPKYNKIIEWLKALIMYRMKNSQWRVKGCILYDLTAVDCNKGVLEDLPLEKPPNVRHIILSEHEIVSTSFNHHLWVGQVSHDLPAGCHQQKDATVAGITLTRFQWPAHQGCLTCWGDTVLMLFFLQQLNIPVH